MDLPLTESYAKRDIEEALAEVETALETIEVNTDCEREEIAALLMAVAVALLAAEYRPAEIHSWATSLIGKITKDLAERNADMQ